MKRTTIVSVVFIVAFCFVSMVTGQRVNTAASVKYEKCLRNLQCRRGTTEPVVLDNTTFCCKDGQRLSFTSALEKVLMRMFFNTVLKGTFPGLVNKNGDSKQRNATSIDSSASDSITSFSDSESMDIRSDSSDSTETRRIPDFLESIRSFVDSRSIREFLDDSNSRDNDGQNTRGLSDELEAIVSRYLNAGGVFIDKRAEMGRKRDRDTISENWDFGKSKNKRAFDNPEKKRSTFKKTRGDSSIERLIRKRFRTEPDVAENRQYRSGKDRWADAYYYFLKKRYLGHDEKAIEQDAEGGARVKKGEAQIPSPILKRDTGFNTEKEGTQRQNRDLDTPHSQVSETRFDRQNEVNKAANRYKREQNKDPNPGVVNSPNKGTSNTGTGVQHRQIGGSQTGPLPAAGDKRKNYLMCKCLIGN